MTVQTYYLASTDTTYGTEHGQEIEPEELRSAFKVLEHPGPSRYDGVSRWVEADGRIRTVLTMLDFFHPDKKLRFFCVEL